MQEITIDLRLDRDRGGRLHIWAKRGRLFVKPEGRNRIAVSSTYATADEEKYRALDSLSEMLSESPKDNGKWHSREEAPNGRDKYLAELEGRFKPTYKVWKGAFANMRVVRWAYIKDLLPEE